MEAKKLFTELLLYCEEENGKARKYVIDPDTYKEEKSPWFGQSKPVRTDPIKYITNKDEVFVVSDLHIASGRNNAGVYTGTENFFADDSFKRFLEYAGRKKGKNLLVINGDIFDFLRVTESPEKKRKLRLSKNVKRALTLKGWQKSKLPPNDEIDKEYNDWINELKKIGIRKTRHELKNSISKMEERYGLQTDDFKTIYKFMKIKNGHPIFFQALGKWLEEDNRLLILKGNHDLELCRLAVRNYLRLILAEEIKSRNQNRKIEEILNDVVFPHITYIDDSVEINDDFYIEHGHRYDKYCMVLDSPLLKKSEQINIPFGSFFNRYLLNRAELFYPFLDNVRPTGNVLPMLFKENFPLGIKVLFHHIPFLIRILFTNFRYVSFMFNKVFWFALAILIPVGLFIYFNHSLLETIQGNISKMEETGGIGAFIFTQAKNLILLFLAYILARVVSWFQLAEPSSLNKPAEKRFKWTTYRISTMGHTHNPGEYKFSVDGKERRFYNTGTWIPIIETSTAEVREDKTYTFLHLIKDDQGLLQPTNNGLLQRWNDDAGRAEEQILIQRK